MATVHPVQAVVTITLDAMRQWDFQSAESAYHVERAAERLAQLVDERTVRLLVGWLRDVRAASRAVVLGKRGAHWRGSEAMHGLTLAVSRAVAASAPAVA